MPNPIFQIQAAATVDEGNNWVNMAYGPLSLVNPSAASGTTNYNAALGDYSITSSSSAINAGSNGASPNHDFFGTPRPQGAASDIGAVEFVGQVVPPAVTLTPKSAAFGNVQVGISTTSAPTQDFTLTNAGPGTFTISAISVDNATGTGGFSRITGAAVPNNCGGTLTVAQGTCTIRVRFRPTTAAGGAISYTGSVTVSGTGPGGAADTVTNSPAPLTGTGVQAVVAFSAPSPALTTTPATTTAKTGTVTVTNSGNGPLTITATPTVARISGATGTFAIVAPLSGTQCVNGSVVAAGGTCTIGVQYTPPTTGTTAQRTATSNGRVTLTDTGAATGTQNSANFQAN